MLRLGLHSDGVLIADVYSPFRVVLRLRDGSSRSYEAASDAGLDALPEGSWWTTAVGALRGGVFQLLGNRQTGGRRLVIYDDPSGRVLGISSTPLPFNVFASDAEGEVLLVLRRIRQWEVAAYRWVPVPRER